MQQIAPGVQVNGQVSADDIVAAAASGVRRVVNNRHDGEDPGQPTSAEVETAVRAAGMDYVHLPIAGMPGPAQVDAVGAILAAGEPTLIYCRSGMRSAAVWAMATARSGRMPADDIRDAAAAVGYDLSRLAL